MKKKISLLLLAALFLFSSQTVLAEEYLIVDRDEQSSGVLTTQYTEDGSWDLFYDAETKKHKIVYTITSDAPDEITIDLSKATDVLIKHAEEVLYADDNLDYYIAYYKSQGDDSLSFRINKISYALKFDTMEIVLLSSPGSVFSFDVVVNNESNKIYSYKEGSLVVATSKQSESNSGVIAFDGQELENDIVSDTIEIGYTQNLENKNLINTMIDKVLQEYPITGFGGFVYTRKNANPSEVRAKLKEYVKEYYKDDITLFIIDEFNNRYSTSYKKLNDFSSEDMDKLLVEISESYMYDIGEVSITKSTKYDYFNMHVLSIVISDEKTYDETYGKDSVVVKYGREYNNDEWATLSNGSTTVGNYMKEKVNNNDSGIYKETDSFLNSTVGKLETGKTSSFVYGINMDYYANNNYQGYRFSYYAAFKMTAEKYNVYVNYIDVDGKVIADQDYYSGIYTGEDYKTAAKTIEGYELVRVDGEATGVMADKDVVVTYVYEYVLGQGGDDIDPEPIVVQTGSEIDYSLMTSAFITASLIVLALRTKKKNN